MLTSACELIPGADRVEMVCLSVRHFPILPDVMDIKFEHATSHWRCTIKRKQVPVEPGFAITVHKVQGQTMNRVLVDLEGCCGTEQPYVMVSRCTSLDGLVILRDFSFSRICRRPAEDLRKEFARLEVLRLQTLIKYGSEVEVQDAKRELGALRGGSNWKKRKKAEVVHDERTKRRKLVY